MTQAEIEAKFESLNEQFSQLQRQQEGIRKQWLRIGLISLVFGVGFAVTCIVFSVMSLSRGVPNPSTPFALTMIPLLLLGIALVLAGGQGDAQGSRR
jgi:glycerol uptake facilitator-like aquaporin